VLGFPFLFRGALDVGARSIDLGMKMAAARALAAVARMPAARHVREIYANEDLSFGAAYVIPKPFDRRLFVEVSHAVASAAVESGAAPACDLGALRRDLEARNLARWGSID
jgi:malate dehydrogenase (oxaloacetate-decarboxylating)(NADP+)